MRFPNAATMRKRCTRSRGMRLHSGAELGGGMTQPQLIPLGTTYLIVTGSTGLPGTNPPDLKRSRTFPVVHVPTFGGTQQQAGWSVCEEGPGRAANARCARLDAAAEGEVAQVGEGSVERGCLPRTLWVDEHGRVVHPRPVRLVCALHERGGEPGALLVAGELAGHAEEAPELQDAPDDGLRRGVGGGTG